LMIWRWLIHGMQRWRWTDGQADRSKDIFALYGRM
jgi:hypothetical protein